MGIGFTSEGKWGIWCWKFRKEMMLYQDNGGGFIRKVSLFLLMSLEVKMGWMSICTSQGISLFAYYRFGGGNGVKVWFWEENWIGVTTFCTVFLIYRGLIFLLQGCVQILLF